MPAIRTSQPEKGRITDQGPSRLFLASRFSAIRFRAPLADPVKLDLNEPWLLAMAIKGHLLRPFVPRISTGGPEDEDEDEEELRQANGERGVQTYYCVCDKPWFIQWTEAKLRVYWTEYAEASTGRNLTDLSRLGSSVGRDDIIDFIRVLQSYGSPEIGGPIDGWSIKRTRVALSRFMGMLGCRGAPPLNDKDWQHVINSLADTTCADTRDGSLGLSNCDYDALLTTIFSQKAMFTSHFHRLQFAMVVGLLLGSGASLAHFSSSDGDAESYIRLDDCHLVIESITQDGPVFSLYIKLRSGKGTDDDDDTHETCHVIQSLPGSKALLDGINLFLALTIRRDVWDFDLLSVVTGKAVVDPALLPLSVPLKGNYRHTPITTSQLERTPSACTALPLAALSCSFQHARDALGWDESVDIVRSLQKSTINPLARDASTVEDNSTEASTRELRENIDTLVSTHPLSDLVLQSGYSNARSEVIQHYLQLLLHDALFAERICPQCFDANFEPSHDLLTDIEAASKILRVHDNEGALVNHMYRCTRGPEMTVLCSFCGVLVPTTEKHEYHAHFETCCSTIGRRLMSTVRKSASEPLGDEPPLGHDIVIFNDHTCKVFFCPVCLVEGTKIHERNFATTSYQTMSKHIIEHFRRGKGRFRSSQPFSTTSNITCPIPGCARRGLGAGAVVKHLYMEHGFPLIECTCEDATHDHSKLDFDLADKPGTMVHFSDNLHRWSFSP